MSMPAKTRPSPHRRPAPRRGHRPARVGLDGFLSVGRVVIWVSIIALASAPPALSAGCDRSAAPGVEPLRISAAASVAEVLNEVGRAFDSTTGTAVEVNAGGSGALAAQVEQGGPCDVFVSADAATIDRLDAAGLLVPGSRRVVAGNRLVLVVPADSPLGTGEFADVADAGRFGRVAVGESRTAPAGRYARQAFAALGVAEAVGPRLVEGLDVRQVLHYVRSGEVDAGVVYASDAASAGGAVRVYAVAPESSHEPVEYVAAVVKASGRTGKAGAFVEFLAGKRGRPAFEARGFLAPTGGQGGD